MAGGPTPPSFVPTFISTDHPWPFVLFHVLSQEKAALDLAPCRLPLPSVRTDAQTTSPRVGSDRPSLPSRLSSSHRRPKVRRRRAIDAAYTQPPRANLTRRPPRTSRRPSHTSRRSHFLPPPPPSTFRFPAAFDLPRRPPLSTPVPSPLRITPEIVALDASIAHHQRTA
ncbi:hypothetical protein K523DRAFT_422436 [Schizophyllum commune Tattone D]|nr:hypothetical protein K523DRAFT_422436 [Schizophyllum commune Tattone D]